MLAGYRRGHVEFRSAPAPDGASLPAVMTLPPDFDRSFFEDAAIMSDAVLWLVRQDLGVTGRILTLTELRRQGVVRPETRHTG